MRKKTFYLTSDYDQLELHVMMMEPKGEIRGIVQICHGMAEHKERYEPFMKELCAHGYAAVIHDHRGHGKSVKRQKDLGYFYDETGEAIVEDVHQISLWIKERYPGIPLHLFGHSMGSMIARDYAAKYGSELAGLTICGTCGAFRGAAETAAKLSEAIAQGKGEESDPAFSAELMGWMCEYCGDIKIGNEWICSDIYVQQDHADDPFDAFTKPTSNRSLYDFTQMMEVINGLEWAKKVPASLPIYNIAGDLDPVGEYGEGVYAVTNWLRATGHNVKTKLYSGYRHEIHNYNDIKDEVEAGIIAFMNENL